MYRDRRRDERHAHGHTGLGSAHRWQDAQPSPANAYRSTYEYDRNGNILALERFDQNGARYDDFEYQYQTSSDGRTKRNRLYHLWDLEPNSITGDAAVDIP
ncbi:hypothetical protein RZS08_02390, partial [Arthrospira platensis SPKY1]|nr:hypothetical protein [Arthrospira platensis SPKY1]